jgi:hypothetical protein
VREQSREFTARRGEGDDGLLNPARRCGGAAAPEVDVDLSLALRERARFLVEPGRHLSQQRSLMELVW